MFNFKTHHKAASVQEAVQLLKANPDTHIIAGGTDVLIKLHKGKGKFDHLVDIHDVAQLNGIKLSGNADLVIGATTCFSDVENSELVNRYIPVLGVAMRTIGGPQVRNMATIGGNICNGVPSADSASPLLALNAVLTIEGVGGQRQLPLADFFLAPGQVALKQGEILTAITIAREDYNGYHGHFYKYAMRDAMDIATIGCAAVCKLEDGKLNDIRLAFGTAAPVPIRCRQTEKKVRGRKLTSQLLDDVAAAVMVDVKPRTSWRATRDFRMQIIKTLAERVVRQAIINAGGNIR